jgi:hypothetical protein
MLSQIIGRIEKSCTVKGGLNYGPQGKVMLEALYNDRFPTTGFNGNEDDWA